MAKSSIPNPLSRRHLLERDLDAPQAKRVAEAYLEAGRRAEAVAFLAKAEEREPLEELFREAVTEGDLFLLKAAGAALGREPSADEWHSLADAAEAAGKLRYAATARRQIDASGES